MLLSCVAQGIWQFVLLLLSGGASPCCKSTVDIAWRSHNTARGCCKFTSRCCRSICKVGSLETHCPWWPTCSRRFSLSSPARYLIWNVLPCFQPLACWYCVYLFTIACTARNLELYLTGRASEMECLVDFEKGY